MTSLKSNRIPLIPTPSACDDDTALQRAHKERTPILALHKAASHLFDRVSRHLREGFSPVIKERELTLEQLLVSLNAVTYDDARLRTHSVSLMLLMASDISDAKQFSIESMLRARPMRAWRERYNGLDALE